MKIEHSIALEANDLCSRYGITPQELIDILQTEQNVLSIKDVTLYDVESNTVPLFTRFKKSLMSDLSTSKGNTIEILCILQKNLLYYQPIEISSNDSTRTVFSIGDGDFATKLVISK